MATTTAEILNRLAETFEDRAKDREVEALAHLDKDAMDLYSYSLGLVAAYRGAARKARYEISQLEG